MAISYILRNTYLSNKVVIAQRSLPCLNNSSPGQDDDDGMKADIAALWCLPFSLPPYGFCMRAATCEREHVGACVLESTKTLFPLNIDF